MTLYELVYLLFKSYSGEVCVVDWRGKPAKIKFSLTKRVNASFKYWFYSGLVLTGEDKGLRYSWFISRAILLLASMSESLSSFDEWDLEKVIKLNYINIGASYKGSKRLNCPSLGWCAKPRNGSSRRYPAHREEKSFQSCTHEFRLNTLLGAKRCSRTSTPQSAFNTRFVSSRSACTC